MSWPSPQDYNESIQTPNVSFDDPELRTGKPVLNAMGLPMPMTGAFASVYRYQCKKRDVAVRCFLQNFSDSQKRYSQISKYIMNDDLSYTVDFEYLEKGIRVNGRWYPILKMDWVEGIPLDRYIDQFAANGPKLSELLIKFMWMVEDLRGAGIAHGDLQHGNILVCGDELRLVDYDGMYVPELCGWKSHEVGHRNYQHPNRCSDDFGPELDRYASWVIATCLHALSVDGSLWHKNMAGDDCLLFKQADLKDPANSRIFDILLNHADESVRNCAALLKEMRRYGLNQLPALTPLADTKNTLDKLLSVKPIARIADPAPIKRKVTESTTVPGERWYDSAFPKFDVQAVMRSAQEAMAGENYTGAVGFLTQLISAEVEPVKTRFLRAQAYLHLGRGADAAEDSEHFANMIRQPNPRTGAFDYCEMRVKALMAANRWDQAELVINAWIRLQPESPDPTIALAKCLFAKRKYRRVIEICDEFTRDRGFDYDLILQRAQSQLKLNNLLAAKSDLTSAIKAKPNRHEAYVARANIQMNDLKHDLANADFTRALELLPEATTFFERAKARQHLKKYDEAQSDYLECIRRTNSQIIREQAYEHMGICLFENQEYAQAADALKTAALSISVDNLSGRGKVAYHAARGFVELERGNYPEATDLFQKADDVSALFDAHVSYGFGLASAKQKKSRQALKLFKKCSNIVNDEDRQCRIAEALLELRKLDEACEWVDAVLLRLPKHTKASVLKADIAKRRGDLKKAQQLCLDALHTNPKDVEALLLLGRVFENQQNFAEATRIFDTVSTASASPRGFVRLGHIHLRQANLDQALSAYEKSASLAQSSDLEALLSIPVLYLKLLSGDSSMIRDEFLTKIKSLESNVLKSLERLKTTHSTFYAVWFLNARRHMLYGEIEMAIECFSLALKIEPDSPGALCARADCFARMQNFTQAQRDYDKAQSLAKRNSMVAVKRAWFIARQENWMAAASAFADALSLNRSNKEAWAGRGLAMARLNQHNVFLKEIDKTAADGKVSLDFAALESGKVYARQMDFPSALGCFEKYREANPLDPNIHVLIAGLLRDSGQIAEAHKELDKAFAINKKFAPALAAKATLLQKENEPDLAFSTYRQARKIDPEFMGSDLSGYFRLLAAKNEVDVPSVGFPKKANSIADQCHAMAAWLNPIDPDLFLEEGMRALNAFTGGKASLSLYAQLARVLANPPGIVELELAFKCFKKTVMLNDSLEAHMGMAVCAYILALKKKSINEATVFQAAFEHASLVVDENRTSTHCRFIRGMVASALEKWELARDDFMIAVHDPAYKIQCHKQLASINLILKEPDKVIEHASHLLEEEDVVFDIWIIVSRAYEAQHDTPKAMRCLNKAIQDWKKVWKACPSHSSHPSTLELAADGALLFRERARLHQRARKWKDARKDYEESLKLNEKDVDSLAELSSVEFELKDYSEAIATIGKALALRPRDETLMQKKELYADTLFNSVSGKTGTKQKRW